MLGWVTGLAAEARLLRGVGVVEVGGGMPAGAVLAAERLVALGATGLISFGLAGGLDPALRAGEIVVPRVVVDGATQFPTDPALCAALGGVTAERLAMGAGILAEVAAKAALFAQTGAVAVDLESGAVARVAAAHGLAFAVLRAVCDPADAALPPAALAALDSAGAIGIWRVARSVIAEPWQIGPLLALARDAAEARRALAVRVAGIAGG